jgi:hypothetical protein
MSPRSFAALCVVALCLTASQAQAAFRPAAPGATPLARAAAAQCSYGYHRDPSGYCVDSMDYSRSCPPTYFPLSFPNGNGYRCAPAEWLGSSGWLNGLLQSWNRGALPR